MRTLLLITSILFYQTDSSPAEPSSLLQLSGGVTHNAKHQMTVAEARKAFEVSREKTDEILHKVQQEMKSLNVQMDKTRDDEQKGMAKLQQEKKDDDKKLEAADKRYEALETKATQDSPSINSGRSISSTSAAASSFMEGPLPDFLEPLRDGARKAQSFADEMKKQEEDLDAVANGRGAPPGFSLIQEGVGGMDAGSREVASAMEAEAADDSRTDKHLAKASDALNALQRSIQDESRELALEERDDTAHKSTLHDDDVLSFLEEATSTKNAGWETDLDRQVRKWRSFLARDSHRRSKHSVSEADDDDDASSLLQLADKSDSHGDWVSKIERYMKEDRQRVLAARDSKTTPSNALVDNDDEDKASSSFLESSMSAEDVRSAIRKEAEKTRDVIKILERVQKAGDGKKTPQGKGPSFVEKSQAHHFNLEKAEEEVGALQAKWAREAKRISVPTSCVPLVLQAPNTDGSSLDDSNIEKMKRKALQADEHVKKVDEDFKNALVSLKSDILAQSKASSNRGASFLQLGTRSRAHEALEKLSAELDADMVKNAEKEGQIEQAMKDAGGSQSLLEETKGKATLPDNLVQAMARLDALAKRLSQGTSPS
ncbi:conserved hypothetical protein [Perkinsus marinus ATCC 50983]|uniref:Uncharacterized protein n=1 Tax=Perkinsus marinus (strain ATCC 50983 / TXsc) TaxID=423536 RepID=C5M0H8_PERM5|nr:conserved hypothetical protein [Perkinsus marinus ATCC 50983]EEQ97513.1 conserved hypothetical protein [Perkinsus marinus ATCC 50983]|eukprot:XP_002764796.1 conserved hypothetical protein [Perkinsus marinus ATCC 50983]